MAIGIEYERGYLEPVVEFIPVLRRIYLLRNLLSVTEDGGGGGLLKMIDVSLGTSPVVEGGGDRKIGVGGTITASFFSRL